METARVKSTDKRRKRLVVEEQQQQPIDVDVLLDDEKNRCLRCNVDMGDSNRRQLCDKTRCLMDGINENNNDDNDDDDDDNKDNIFQAAILKRKLLYNDDDDVCINADDGSHQRPIKQRTSEFPSVAEFTKKSRSTKTTQMD